MTTTYENMKKRLEETQDGRALVLAEYMAMWEEFKASKSAIATGLLKYTTKELLPMSGSYRMEKKDYLIQSTINRLVDAFISPVSGDKGWWAFSETREAWAERLMVSLTQEMLDAFSAKMIKFQEELDAQKAKIEKAIAQPETYEEYKIFVHEQGFKALTPEMRERLDMFVAYDQVGKVREEMEREAQVKQIKLEEVAEGLEFEIEKGWHSKRLCDIWTIFLNQRIENDKWHELDAKARKFGGRYSGWSGATKGWIFYNEEEAMSFLDLQNGDGNVMERLEKRKVEKQRKAAERLVEMADTREEAAEDSLNADRKTNTAKRAREAGYAEQTAREDIKMAHVLRSMAEAMLNDEVFLLSGVRYAVDVQLLESLLEQAKREAIRTEHPGDYGAYEKEKDRNVVLSDVRKVEFPWPWLNESEAKLAAKELKGTRGLKYPLATIAGIKPIKESVKCFKPEHVEAMREVVKHMHNSEYILQRFENFDRLWRMGLRNPYSLRAALREFMQFRDGTMPPIDKARVMELDLVGLKIPGFFPTPYHVVDQMIELAGIGPNGAFRILEPSAGSGRIAEKVRLAMADDSNLEVCEINHRLREILTLKNFNIVGEDFVEFAPGIGEVYDAIMMNPPFEYGQDALHVQIAYDLLVEGGIVVAIMGEHPFFAGDSGAVAFRGWLETVNVEYNEKLPEGTFKESGTGVNTRLIAIRK